MKTFQFRSFAVLFLSQLTIHAELQLAPLFTDNAVLQQGKATPIWGWADDGETITVKFRGQKITATARNGKWSANLRNLKAGGPDVLTVSSPSSTFTFTNVLV